MRTGGIAVRRRRLKPMECPSLAVIESLPCASTYVGPREWCDPGTENWKSRRPLVRALATAVALGLLLAPIASAEFGVLGYDEVIGRMATSTGMALAVRPRVTYTTELLHLDSTPPLGN